LTALAVALIGKKWAQNSSLNSGYIEIGNAPVLDFSQNSLSQMTLQLKNF